MTDSRTQQDQLIDALYDLALNPNNFTSFTEAWEQYLSDKEQSPSSSEEIPERLSHHFDRAFQILEKFGRYTGLENLETQQFINQRELPSLAINLQGGVLAINQFAAQVFQIKETDSINPKTTLDQLVHDKSRPAISEAISRIAVSQTFPVVVLLCNNQPALMLMQRSADSDTIIVDITGSTWNKRMQGTLQSMYKLTDAECMIASLLYQGLNANQIAEQQSRALDTVRQHIKAVLRKTQTHSQPRLMRLLTSFNLAQSNDSKVKWANTKCSNYRITLDDGRHYAYYDTGPANKKVIVVLHGVLHDPELPNEMHQQLLEAGYRIIGPSRAWFGESSPNKSTRKLLETCAQDLIELLDHLGLSKATLLGNMAGSAHAYFAAANYPNRVERIINISGMVPLRDKKQIQAMPKGVRAVVKTAKYFPKMLPTLIRTALALIDSGDIYKLFNTIYKSSPIDIAATKRDAVFQRLNTGYLFAAHNGSAAYINEGLALAEDLTPYLEEVQCSVCLIHGAHDGITTIDSVSELSHSFSNLHLSAIDDAGHLLMYTNPRTASRLLMERLSTKV